VRLIAPTAKPVKLDPVWANRGTEAWYRARLRELLKAMHDSLQLHIEATYKREPPTIGMAQDASSTVALRKTLKQWGDRWSRRFDEMAVSIAEQFAKKSTRATQISMLTALKKAGFTVEFKPTAKSIEAYRAVVASNVGLIKTIPQQYLKDVEQSVYNAVMRGGDLHTLSKSLVQSYGVSYRRAAIIARTENNKAKALMEATRRQELGLTESVWQHSSAGKVPRPTHVKMSGKRYKNSQGMWDSAEQKYVFPGELINCRCASRSLIPGLPD